MHNYRISVSLFRFHIILKGYKELMFLTEISLDKQLTEIIRRTDGEQILSVTLNQINNTRIHSRKQLGSC